MVYLETRGADRGADGPLGLLPRSFGCVKKGRWSRYRLVQITEQGRKIMRTGIARRALGALAIVGVLAAMLLGSVGDAQASPVSRAQAVRKAHEYLQFEAFSLKGLVNQLKFEGFSTADATYGASHSGADWFKEAAAKAKSYLQMQAFSRSGLIAQLRFEGFTAAQALYGVRAVGL